MIGFKSLCLAGMILPALMTQSGSDWATQHLQVGMKVPNLTGVDQDGKNVSLSSYRGKVVVLDFFGFW